MAAPYNPPKKNEDFLMHICLHSMGNPGEIQSNPTIAAGDFTVSKDYAAFANLATLPDVEPNSTVGLRVQMSATEMNADGVLIVWRDQTAPKEWADGWMFIPTTA
jgi:hypothetical protein